MIDEEDFLFTDDESENDHLLFVDDDDEDPKDGQVTSLSDTARWKVLVVDDEEEIHNVTRFALHGYEYKGKKLQFLHAYNGEQAIRLLQENQDVALILLDVVMESNDAGLRVVEKIRYELKNVFVRIVMRTGQPGQAPEDEVIIKYDINDYKNKTELTDKKLFTTLTTGLRSYSDIMEIESYRQNLEEKVQQRTEEVIQQKEIIEKKNQEITASINYAKRIQDAMLPGIQVMKQIIPNLFVLFRPRDIVSGDFYWFAQKDGKTIIAAVDCTGHGVPGAFMSMVGDANLSQIVNAHGVTSPDMILNRLHIRIRQSLKQEHTQNRDGMDMTICTIDWAAGVVEFAGAKNPLVYIQNGEIHQIKGSRLPIGGEQKEAQRIFEKHLIALRGPTTLYMFSDGFADQFGGPHNKRYMIKNLRQVLLDIHQQDLDQQKLILEQILDDWKGPHNRQTDDVLVIGFRIG